MKKTFWLLICPFILQLASQTLLAQQRQPDGVLFELKSPRESGPRRLKIQVCADNIFRVVASAADTFSTRPSLMVARTSWETVPFTVRDVDGLTEIVTSKLAVRVNPANGAVSWFTPDGRPLLAERAGGCKILTPAEVLGEQTWHVQQIFDSPADEAFYGLGNHQNGIMNWKGHDVVLAQENIVDAVPFLVSSRSYGILWDNYSLTKFGDIRDYEPLSTLTLFTAKGAQGGLTVDYFRDSTFGNLLLSQTEPDINHAFNDAPGVYPAGFDLNKGSIRWSGELASDTPGLHKLRLYASSYVKVWLNGKLEIDSWRQNWLPWTRMLSLQMEPGKRYSVKIEWIPNGGSIGLTTLPPGDPM